MTTIRLTGHEWRFDESDRLGPPGGFGEVFRGAGSSGEVAVKRLNLTAGQAAHREMSIGEALASRSLQHVVPVLDFGQDSETDRYFLVMPVCEGSLQDALAGGFDFEAAKTILLDIAAGLQEVGNLVHRDLKPGNVLRHEDTWKIADFGIAKFVEDSTSLETLRGSLTPSYGAPEQWRGERPSKATDVYALACIAHTLLNGRPPFIGDADDVREGHLHAAPPALQAPPMLAAVVSQMLRKSPEARPSLERFISALDKTEAAIATGPRAALAQAAEKIARERSAAEAAEAERRSQVERWRALAREAIGEFTGIRDRLFTDITAFSDDAARTKDGVEWGSASLSFGDPQIADFVHPDDRRGDSDWEVVAWSVNSLRCRHASRGYGESGSYTYGTTLFFGRRRGEVAYRWHEVSFWNFGGNDNAPFGLRMNDREAQIALSRTMGVTNVAMQPTVIDAEDEVAFQNRWMSLVARAAVGELRRPNQMPPPPNFYD